jgi:hypothetical protein
VSACELNRRSNSARGPGAQIEKIHEARVSVDDAHLATQHVDQLRQGLDSGMPEEFTNLCRLLGPRRCRELRIVHGGPKFQRLQTPAVAANTGLPVQNGTRAHQLDPRRNNKHQG